MVVHTTHPSTAQPLLDVQDQKKSRSTPAKTTQLGINGVMAGWGRNRNKAAGTFLCLMYFPLPRCFPVDMSCETVDGPVSEGVLTPGKH